MRVYLPATIAMLSELSSSGEFLPVNGTAFAVTPALREFYTSGSTEELEYAALLEAARASLRLIASERDLAGEQTPVRTRRVVVSADMDDVTVRSDLDDAVVRLSGSVPMTSVAAVHVDTADAESAVSLAAEVVDSADLGDQDAELALGDVEDHELAWYAPQEVPFLLELM